MSAAGQNLAGPFPIDPTFKETIYWLCCNKRINAPPQRVSNPGPSRRSVEMLVGAAAVKSPITPRSTNATPRPGASISGAATSAVPPVSVEVLPGAVAAPPPPQQSPTRSLVPEIPSVPATPLATALPVASTPLSAAATSAAALPNGAPKVEDVVAPAATASAPATGGAAILARLRQQRTDTARSATGSTAVASRAATPSAAAPATPATAAPQEQQQPPAAAAAAAAPAGKPPVTVLYGSQTGTCQEIARNLAAEAVEKGYVANVASLNELGFAAVSALRTPLLVIVSSSTGDGDPPDNATSFFTAMRRKPPPGAEPPPAAPLAGVRYTVLGLGDSNYTRFMYVPRSIKTRLAELGATEFYACAEADEVEGVESVVEPWTDGLWAALERAVAQVPLSVETMDEPAAVMAAKLPVPAAKSDASPAPSVDAAAAALAETKVAEEAAAAKAAEEPASEAAAAEAAAEAATDEAAGKTVEEDEAGTAAVEEEAAIEGAAAETPAAAEAAEPVEEAVAEAAEVVPAAEAPEAEAARGAAEEPASTEGDTDAGAELEEGAETGAETRAEPKAEATDAAAAEMAPAETPLAEEPAGDAAEAAAPTAAAEPASATAGAAPSEEAAQAESQEDPSVAETCPAAGAAAESPSDPDANAGGAVDAGAASGSGAAGDGEAADGAGESLLPDALLPVLEAGAAPTAAAVGLPTIAESRVFEEEPQDAQAAAAEEEDPAAEAAAAPAAAAAALHSVESEPDMLLTPQGSLHGNGGSPVPGTALDSTISSTAEGTNRIRRAAETVKHAHDAAEAARRRRSVEKPPSRLQAKPILVNFPKREETVVKRKDEKAYGMLMGLAPVGVDTKSAPALLPPRIRIAWEKDEARAKAVREREAARPTREERHQLDPAGNYSAAQPFWAHISDARYETAFWSDRKVLHLELSVRGSNMAYEPGDSVGVLPVNHPDLVANLCKRLKHSPDKVLHIHARAEGQAGAAGSGGAEDGRDVASPSGSAAGGGGSAGGARVASHLPSPATLGYLLSHCVDLTGVTRKSVLRLLAEHTHDAAEKRTLLFLSARGGKDAYAHEIAEHQPSLLDLLVRFPSCNPPLDALLDGLPPLAPRMYSVSSSRRDPGRGPNRLSVALSVVRFKTRYGTRQGVATTWLDRLAAPFCVEGCEPPAEPIWIPIFLRRAADFKPPADLATPLIMVGPGTGVAPFRGFLQERRAAIAEQKPAPESLGEAVLFFGCRREDEDYLYQADLEGFKADGTLSGLHVAFSRAKADKVYVQDLLKEQGEKVWALLQAGAHVYVCGDGVAMSKDVHAALAGIAVQHGGLSEADAASYLQELSAARRYVRDVWS